MLSILQRIITQFPVSQHIYVFLHVDRTCDPIPNDIIPGTNGGVYPIFCSSELPRPVEGTTCHLYCRNGFTLQDITEAMTTVTCQSDGTWDVDIDTISPFCKGK